MIIPQNAIETMTESYINTALWTSFENNEDYTAQDLHCYAKLVMRNNCESFLAIACGILPDFLCEESLQNKNFVEQLGHDFWLTRNGHGAGFWDREEIYGEQDNADKLTMLAEALKSCELYTGDDNKINIV